MGRPKGSKNGTSKVAHSKQETQQARKRASAAPNNKAGQGVHTSTKRVQRPRKIEVRDADQPVSSFEEPSAPRKPRTRKVVQAPPVESAWSIWDTFLVLLAGMVLLGITAVIAVRFL